MYKSWTCLCLKFPCCVRRPKKSCKKSVKSYQLNSLYQLCSLLQQANICNIRLGKRLKRYVRGHQSFVSVVGQDESQVKTKFLSLLTLIIHGSWTIRVRRQRKLRIKLGWIHFQLNFILTFNIAIVFWAGYHNVTLNVSVTKVQTLSSSE